MRFHISHQLQRYKWWTNILIVLGRQECLHLSEHVLYWSLVVQTFGALPGLVWLVYLRLRCTHTRSGGPSLRQSARYPSAFAKWVADQHANCMDSWLNMQHCVPASWLVWLLAIYSHRANKWDTHAYTHYNIYIYTIASHIYICDGRGCVEHTILWLQDVKKRTCVGQVATNMAPLLDQIHDLLNCRVNIALAWDWYLLIFPSSLEQVNSRPGSASKAWIAHASHCWGACVIGSFGALVSIYLRNDFMLKVRPMVKGA